MVFLTTFARVSHYFLTDVSLCKIGNIALIVYINSKSVISSGRVPG